MPEEIPSTIRFFSLASGSSGNCYFLGTTEYGILIDAGIGIRTIIKTLKEINIDLSQILGVFVTHDHADHVKTIGCLADKHHLPIFATPKVHDAVSASRYLEDVPMDCCRFIEKERSVVLRDFTITPFDVPHDASDNVGYSFEFQGNVLTLATDVGHITPRIAHYMGMATHIVIEANYDEEMLRDGSYPSFLKERITSPTGHLSNRQTAEFLVNTIHPNTEAIWLCHLSKDNNHPELAFKTVEFYFRNYGIVVGKDIKLTTLKRTNPSEVYYFAVKE